jgi:hypothetical protein
MAQKPKSSKRSKGPEATRAAGAAVVERSKDAPKAGDKKPAVPKKPASGSARKKSAAKTSTPLVKAARTASTKAESSPKATESQHRGASKSSGDKSSIASKVVKGLKATATGALGAVSLAAQALTSEKKPGKRK